MPGLQGHQLLSTLSDACKVLQVPYNGKAAAKRAIRLLEAAAKQLSAAQAARQNTSVSAAAAAFGAAPVVKVAHSEAAGVSPLPISLTPAGSAPQVKRWKRIGSHHLCRNVHLR